MGNWKPSHTGVRMATSTMLVLAGSLLFPSAIHEHLQNVPASFIPPNPNWVSSLGDTGPLNLLSFFLTGRVSTDANESLHSQLRCNNNMHPQAKRCRARLRLITLANFKKCSTDDDPILIEYSDYMSRQTEGLSEPVEIPEVCMSNPLPPLPLVTTQTLYYLSGWAIFKELRKSSCKVCSEFSLSTVGSTDHSYATTHSDDPSLFTVIKSRGGLKHPSQRMHEYHLLMYNVMQQSMPALLQSDDPIGQVMTTLDRQTEWLPVCHRISRRMVKRLAMLRLHLLVKQASTGPVEVQYDSRSAKRATSVN